MRSAEALRAAGMVVCLPTHLGSPDGYRVEAILVQRSLRRSPRLYLRVTCRGRWLADCTTAAEVAALVALETLQQPRREVCTFRVTRRPGAWPNWPLIEDFEADELVMEDNGRRKLLLVRREPVLGLLREVVFCRLDERDVVAVRRKCELPARWGGILR
jgi:hypothetical protein